MGLRRTICKNAPSTELSGKTQGRGDLAPVRILVNIFGMFQIFPSTQMEQNLGHFILSLYPMFPYFAPRVLRWGFCSGGTALGDT